LHFSRSRLILSKNLIYFRRGREIGSHAWRRSTKFHGDYVNQHHTDSRSSSDYRKCKTIFSDSHLPCHVTIVNRHFCKVKVVWKKLKYFFFFSRHLIEIMYRKITLPLVHLGSCELKLSDDEIQTFVKEDVTDSAWDQRKTYLRVNLKREIQLQTVFRESLYPQWQNLRRTTKFHVIM